VQSNFKATTSRGCRWRWSTTVTVYHLSSRHNVITSI